MNIDQISNQNIRQFLLDLGFDQYSDFPGWAYDLAERMIDQGWVKP